MFLSDVQSHQTRWNPILMSKQNQRKPIRIVETTTGNQIRKRNSNLATKKHLLKEEFDVYPNAGPAHGRSTASARMKRAGQSTVNYGGYRMHGNPANFPPSATQMRDSRIINDAIAPVGVGSSVRGSYLRHSGRPQANTDITGNGGARDGSRIEFADMCSVVVNSDGITLTKGLLSGGTNIGGIQCGPTLVSPRLAAMTALYSYYAFRELELTYIPLVGSSSTGDIALAIDMGLNQTGPDLTTGITQTKVLEHAVTGATNVWKPMTLVYRFSGSKLWYTSSVNQTGPTFYQFILWGSFGGTVATATLGNLYFKGVCDVYKTSEIVNSPAEMEDQIWKRFISEEFHRYMSRPTAENYTWLEFWNKFSDEIKLRERKKVYSPKPLTKVAYDPFAIASTLVERKVPEGKKD